jgi:translation initiation factor 4A
MIEGLKVKTVFGGKNFDEVSIFSTKNTPHIICGCPGRVYDMMRRDRIIGKNIKLIILDEADEMLSSGFKEQIYNIFQFFNCEIQVALFSATLPDSITPIVDKIMRNPIKIIVKKEQLTLEGIKQYFVAIDDDRQKYITLKDLFSYISISQCIIYCNSIKRVQDLYEAMCEDSFPVCRIHSNMDKIERDNAFNDFRKGSSRVLISSNVTARGIDIQQVNIVINFDLPKCIHTYLHRIGRSGRWGRKGVGINFITKKDIFQIKKIEEHYETQIEELPSDISFLKNV